MAGWWAAGQVQVVESLQQWGQVLWPHRCCLCAQVGHEGRDLCRSCLQLGWRNDRACPRCAMPLGVTQDVCAACLAQAGREQAGTLEAVHAAWLYAAPVDALVRRYKFSGDLAAGKVLSQLMMVHPPPWLQPGLVLVPVPLHRQRLRERGHDQARELARRLSRGTGLAWCDGLVRVAATAAQSSLPLEQRQRNLRNAFAAGGPLPGRVVLVDDVMTSGATLAAAARALREGGATEVRAWVAARTP